MKNIVTDQMTVILSGFPFIIVLAFGSMLIYFLVKSGLTKWANQQISSFIQESCAMPRVSKKEIFSTIARIFWLNWYSLFVLIILWFVLFRTDIGKDLVEDYLSNLVYFDLKTRCLSLWFLFSCLLLTSIAIWIIPFFLYTSARRKSVLGRFVTFYLGTKLLAILAIIPFYIVANVFLSSYITKFSLSTNIFIISNILVIIGCIIVHRLLGVIIKRVSFIKFSIEKYGLIFKNRYIKILASIIILEVFLIVLASTAITESNSDLITCIFLFVSSGVIFRLMFFSDESRATRKEIKENVLRMLSEQNANENKVLYWVVSAVLLLLNLYYYWVSSLTGTNSIYVLFSIFGLYIIYMDYFRNLFQTQILWKQILSVAAFGIFLIAPFLSPNDQFCIPLTNVEQAEGLVDKKSFNAGKKPSFSNNLESALRDRVQYINSINNQGYVYIICGMGGGSRAGYITASVLQKIDKVNPAIWDQTICYSTVSGSSPGVYHYLRTKIINAVSPTSVIESIYHQNYNSSGVYGLLLGDPAEALFGGLLGKVKSIFTGDQPKTGYYDRNYRIRTEYDMALNNALIDGKRAPIKKTSISDDYVKRTFAYGLPKAKPELFKGFFSKMGRFVPIQLVNSFEISSGRRTILSPYLIDDTTYFSNSILPLQDKDFDRDILKKDISYREAVNLSELFPFVSAASTIGSNVHQQFVDGGNFENYGLATGMDIARYLIEKGILPKERIKIVLVKNSKQIPKFSTKKAQLIAPLVGVLNAPFTGHANHFLREVQKVYGAENFIPIEFDSNKEGFKVPLTRALTKSHIATMKTYMDTLDLSMFRNPKNIFQ